MRACFPEGAYQNEGVCYTDSVNVACSLGFYTGHTLKAPVALLLCNVKPLTNTSKATAKAAAKQRHSPVPIERIPSVYFTGLLVVPTVQSLPGLFLRAHAGRVAPPALATACRVAALGRYEMRGLKHPREIPAFSTRSRICFPALLLSRGYFFLACACGGRVHAKLCSVGLPCLVLHSASFGQIVFHSCNTL